MKSVYSDISIRSQLEGCSIHASNFIFEQFTRTVPSHSHGSGCYELHYISQGFGRLVADGKSYDITPDIFYVTGPHVEHAQFSMLSDPMQEYCIYLKARKPASPQMPSPLMDAFLSRPFWFGKTDNRVFPLIKQIFEELSCKYTGYQKQISLLLAQLLITLVRNYEQQEKDSRIASPCKTPDRLSSNSCPTVAKGGTAGTSSGIACAAAAIPKSPLSSEKAGEQPLPGNITDRTSIIIEEYFLYEYDSLSLETLSRRLNLSPRQTQRLIWAYYGKTFQQKKTDARMSAASILLKHANESITTIANELGYSSPEHFSNAFRRYYGMSPRQYRNSRKD